MSAAQPAGPAVEAAQCLPPLAPVWRVAKRLPRGSCDAHFHVFGPASEYPLDPRRGYTPSPADIDDYRQVMEAYGIDRAVAVQPSVYGFDNSAMFAALAAMPDALRGVGVIAPDAPEALFAEAHRLGVRGLRINPRNPAGLTMQHLARVGVRAVALGWHIQLQIAIDDHPDLTTVAARAGVPIVIDHFGFPDLARGADDRAFAGLVDLAASGACFVKLSAPYRNAGEPDCYPLLAPFVERLVERAPDSLLWGLDWPHTECFEAIADDNPILDLIWDWLPSNELRRKVLIDNPSRLYWNGEPLQPSPGSTQ